MNPDFHDLTRVPANGAQWFRRLVKELGWCPVKQYCTEGDPLRHEEYGLFRGPDRNIEIN